MRLRKERGPIELIWKIAIRAEAAVAEGKVFGGFLWDMEKMYDKIGHARAVVCARRLGFPEGLIQASLAADRSARFIQYA